MNLIPGSSRPSSCLCSAVIFHLHAEVLLFLCVVLFLLIASSNLREAELNVLRQVMEWAETMEEVRIS